jgi:hypothetical protein
VPEIPAGTDESSNGPEVVFEESEVEPIIGNPPGYEEVIFEESEVKPIIGNPPGYGEVIFEESEVEPIVGRRRPQSQQSRRQPGYDVVIAPQEITFTESEVEPIVVAGRRWPRSEAGWPPLIRPPLRRGYISFELSDAWDLPRPLGMYGGMSEAQLQVLSWLQAHAAEIEAAERLWRVDRRAIAAAIAWEALENVWPFSIRAVGPGKVHYNSSVVNQVEDAGYLPKRSVGAREALLRTPSGAIEYIGAIMAAQADVAASFGYNIRCNVPILTNEFQGRDIEQWRAHLASRKAGSPLEPGNTMGIWSRENLPYMEFGVGTPDPGICSGR